MTKSESCPDFHAESECPYLEKNNGKCPFRGGSSAAKVLNITRSDCKNAKAARKQKAAEDKQVEANREIDREKSRETKAALKVVLLEEHPPACLDDPTITQDCIHGPKTFGKCTLCERNNTKS